MNLIRAGFSDLMSEESRCEKGHVICDSESPIIADEIATVLLPDSIAPIAPMDAKATHHKLPNIRFRVLVLGRANAGLTSILLRVCDTTESPTIYRRKDSEEVRDPRFLSAANTILL
jgi:hypothetical protein